MAAAEPPVLPWLVLIHQIPPRPASLRVKVWRRLQTLGALSLKNSVYVLPNGDETREDLAWVLRELRTAGAQGSLCEARLVDGLDDAEVRATFVALREADYRRLAAEIRALAKTVPAARRRPLADDVRARLDTALGRLRKQLAEVQRIDFFGAPGREAAAGLLAAIETRLHPQPSTPRAARRPWQRDDVQGRTWVTRRGIHIDRIASAWLIRRAIDPTARFRFVTPKGHVPADGELRFDMFDAEFTHDGDLCTFEVLLRDFALDDPALGPIAEIVHDVDLKEQRHDRPETAGVEHLIAGICRTAADDEQRLAQGTTVFDGLHAWFQRRRP
ncbi:MAG: chromate resistance protein [bacterium]|nr:chromate resistance protein [bacterium]